MSEPALRIRILSEDSGADAYETVRKLVRHLLLCVDANLNTAPSKLSVTPLPEDGRQRVGVPANAWKAKAGYAKQLELARYLADRLHSGEFVLHHFDGDCAWSQRPGENQRKYDTLVVSKLRNVLSDKGLESLAGRLLVLRPHWSIESWLFQHEDARRHCTARHPGQAQHARWFDEWYSDRTSIDEFERPKDRLDCIGDRHNAELAGDGFPAAVLDAAERSFHETVERLRGCTDLVKAIRSTYAPPRPESDAS